MVFPQKQFQWQNSFFQISQSVIIVGLIFLVIINEKKILFKKGLLTFFCKINGFPVKEIFNEKLTKDNYIVSNKSINLSFIGE